MHAAWLSCAGCSPPPPSGKTGSLVGLPAGPALHQSTSHHITHRAVFGPRHSQLAVSRAAAQRRAAGHAGQRAAASPQVQQKQVPISSCDHCVLAARGQLRCCGGAGQAVRWAASGLKGAVTWGQLPPRTELLLPQSWLPPAQARCLLCCPCFHPPNRPPTHRQPANVILRQRLLPGLAARAQVPGRDVPLLCACTSSSSRSSSSRGVMECSWRAQ